MTPDSQTESRRSIEALRAGVPNRDAVRALGSSQPALEEKFRQQLKAAKEGFPQGIQAKGMLVAGDFGSGKSHLLEHFQHIALENNFVCSKVVISKETPLFDPAKVYRAAIQETMVPGRRGAALGEIATNLKFDSPAYADFYKWVNSPNAPISSRFAATVYLYEYGRADEEMRDRVIRFWSGDPIGVAELRKWLKEMGEAATYKIDKVLVKELALQRYVFASRLIVAAGYSGWVLLIDEVELVRLYSWQQRARSYAEVAHWLGELVDSHLPGLTCVLTIIPTFESVVLDERNDEEKIPGKLRATGSDSDRLLASQAERGMQLIRKNKLPIQRPDSNLISQTFQKLRAIYTSAYGWEPPKDYAEPDITARMRQHVKRWITGWDLERLYPGYEPEIEIGPIGLDYREMPEIETPSEGLSEDQGT